MPSDKHVCAQGLGEVKGEMMEITPSEPLAEAFVETEEENTEEMVPQ